MKFFIKIKKTIKIDRRSFLCKHTTSIFFIVGYILYYLSLEKCWDGEELCGNNMSWIYKKVIELILSCELLSLSVATIIFNYNPNYI